MTFGPKTNVSFLELVEFLISIPKRFKATLEIFAPKEDFFNLIIFFARSISNYNKKKNV
jgi:hypothetical protein